MDMKFEHVGENVDAADTEAVWYCTFAQPPMGQSGGCPCFASAACHALESEGARSRLIENLSQK